MKKKSNLIPGIKSMLIALGCLSVCATGTYAQAPYCTMTYANSCSSHGTNQVTIGSFTHAPACNASSKYQNYTAQNINITAGVPTTFSLRSIGWTGIGMAADFNNDNDFSDPGELLLFPAYIAQDPATYTGTVTVPPGVPAGNYRVRIWNRGGNSGGAAITDPCGAGFGYGRYLDYTLVVANNASCIAPGNVTVVPAANTAAISWAASTSNPANYRWVVMANGDDPAIATPVAAGTTSATTASANGLSSVTDYDVYVKSLCNASDSSVWTLVTDFSTLCNGMPATGVADASEDSVCANISFNLNLTGVTAAPGITYQWQSSNTASGPFTNISGATTPAYTATQTTASFYRCIVKCTESNDSTISNVKSVTMKLAANCYCTPTSTTGTSYYITGFTTSNGILNINNTGTGSGSYNNYLATQSVAAVQGNTVDFTLTTNSNLVYRSIYVDWNQDGYFDETTEKVFTANYTTVNNDTVSGSITVPFTATSGNTRMRVRSAYYLSTTMHACNNLSYGEAEDYTFNVIPNTPCSGTPPVGVATAVDSICPNNNFNLTVSGIPIAAGISYQWQSSGSATGIFTNITGGTTPVFTTTQTAATYYRCIVKCGNDSTISNVKHVTLKTAANCYCTPTSTTGTSYHITAFSTTGGASNITNTGTGSGSYNNYSATHSASVIPGATLNFSLTCQSGSAARAIYVDWNQDGYFDEVGERVYYTLYPNPNTPVVTGSFLVPFTAMPGATRMRVRTSYYSNVMNACNLLSNGEAEDYTLNLLPATGICVNPINLVASNITPTAATVDFTAPTVGNAPVNYIYELRTSGIAGSGAAGLDASGSFAGATANNLANLSPATDYTLYVRTFCAVGDSSNWISTTFTTTFDTLTPVSLGQLNADVIANGTGTVLSSTTHDVDNANWAFVAEDFKETASSAAPLKFFPANRIIQNGIKKYRLADYADSNALRQTLAQTSKAVRFLAPKRANKVYLMGVGGGNINFNAIIHFSDNTTQVQPMSFPSWYSATGNIVKADNGRVNRNTNALEAPGPKLYDSAIVIAAQNRNKQIDSIVIERTGTASGISVLLAVSIVPNINQACKLPGTLSITNTTCWGGTLSWQGNGTSNNYQISYGPVGTLANNGTMININGGNTGANTHQFVNTTADTNLQLYVRASCGANTYSDWVGPLEVILPGSLDTPMFTLPADICTGSTPPVLPAISDNAISGTWSPATVNNTTGGTYTFTPSATFPCAVPKTITINVTGQIIPSFTQIQPLCQGATAPLLPATSNNGYTGTWTPAAVNNTASGTYTFTPVNGNACLGNASMNIVVNPVSEDTVALTICSDDMPYTWNNILVTSAGPAAAVYTTANTYGCDSLVTLNLTVVNNTNPAISIAANPAGNLPAGASVTFTATLQDAFGSSPAIQWYVGTNAIPGANAMTWTAIAGTDFLNGDHVSVKATGFNHCASAQQISSNPLQMNIGVGIDEPAMPKNFKLYPNPTHNSIIHVEGMAQGDKYRVYDILGRLQLNGTVPSSNRHTIDLHKIPSGVYLIVFENEAGQTWSRKMTKQ